MIGFWAIGYALMFGADKAGLIGTTGFFLAGDYYDAETLTMFFFQSVFMATAATIVSGAIAERTVFKAYCVYSFIISLTGILMASTSVPQVAMNGNTVSVPSRFLQRT